MKSKFAHLGGSDLRELDGSVTCFPWPGPGCLPEPTIREQDNTGFRSRLLRKCLRPCTFRNIMERGDSSKNCAPGSSGDAELVSDGHGGALKDPVTQHLAPRHTRPPPARGRGGGGSEDPLWKGCFCQKKSQSSRELLPVGAHGAHPGPVLHTFTAGAALFRTGGGGCVGATQVQHPWASCHSPPSLRTKAEHAGADALNGPGTSFSSRCPVSLATAAHGALEPSRGRVPSGWGGPPLAWPPWPQPSPYALNLDSRPLTDGPIAIFLCAARLSPCSCEPV